MPALKKWTPIVDYCGIFRIKCTRLEFKGGSLEPSIGLIKYSNQGLQGYLRPFKSDFYWKVTDKWKVEFGRFHWN